MILFTSVHLRRYPLDSDEKDFSIEGFPMKYTCEDYRQEMKLMALRKRLEEEDLSKEEKARLAEEIKKLEQEIKLA